MTTHSPITFTPKLGAAAPVAAVVVDECVQRLKHLDGALLPILHAIQEALGYIPDSAVPHIAQALNLSRAEVHGVVTYYDHFHSQALGKVVVQVCRAEACQAMGGDALLTGAQAAYGCSPAQVTSSDGAVTVEAAYCLGLCAQSPAAMVNGTPHARLSLSRLQHIVASVA